VGTEGNGDDGSTDHPLAKRRTQDPKKKKRPRRMKSLMKVATNRKNGGGEADLPGLLVSVVELGFHWS